MELTEKTVRREELLNGRVLKMHIDEVELPDGSRASRECVDHPGGVHRRGGDGSGRSRRAGRGQADPERKINYP